MRVDRIEPTKNIVRGFQVYAQVLADHPELYGKVVFLAFLVPLRQALPEYKRYAQKVLKSIEDIDAHYGTDEWRPIHTLWGNDRTRAPAALQFYDVLLVNPILDGMNLVAKEGPVVNQRNGVLVLSRTAGAFQQLAKACIPTSPTDVAETAQALYTALTLPAPERPFGRIFCLCMHLFHFQHGLNVVSFIGGPNSPTPVTTRCLSTTLYTGSLSGHRTVQATSWEPI